MSLTLISYNAKLLNTILNDADKAKYNFYMGSQEKEVSLLSRDTLFVSIDLDNKGSITVRLPINHNEADKASGVIAEQVINFLDLMVESNNGKDKVLNQVLQTPFFNAFVKTKNARVRSPLLNWTPCHSCHLMGAAAGETLEVNYKHSPTLYTAAYVNGSKSMDHPGANILDYVNSRNLAEVFGGNKNTLFWKVYTAVLNEFTKPDCDTVSCILFFHNPIHNRS